MRRESRRQSLTEPRRGPEGLQSTGRRRIFKKLKNSKKIHIYGVRGAKPRIPEKFIASWFDGPILSIIFHKEYLKYRCGSSGLRSRFLRKFLENFSKICLKIHFQLPIYLKNFQQESFSLFLYFCYLSYTSGGFSVRTSPTRYAKDILGFFTRTTDPLRQLYIILCII